MADLLKELSDEGMLEGTGYGADELGELLEGLGQEPTSREPCDLNYDKSKELVKKWEVKEGQVWVVGRHRLMCGSCLDDAHLDALLEGSNPSMVYADPPYGIRIVSSNGIAGTVGGGKPFGSKATGTVVGGKLVKVNKYAVIAGDGDVNAAIESFNLLCKRNPFPEAVHIWWGGNYYADKLPPSSC